MHIMKAAIIFLFCLLSQREISNDSKPLKISILDKDRQMKILDTFIVGSDNKDGLLKALETAEYFTDSSSFKIRFLLAAISKKESAHKNANGHFLGYWQMSWTTVKSLRRVCPELPTVRSRQEFLSNISIQRKYAERYLYYFVERFNLNIDKDVAKMIMMYNQGEGKWKNSKHSYFSAIVKDYSDLQKKIITIRV